MPAAGMLRATEHLERPCAAVRTAERLCDRVRLRPNATKRHQSLCCSPTTCEANAQESACEQGEGVGSGAGQARTVGPTLAVSRPGVEPGASWSHEASIRLYTSAPRVGRGGFESIAPSDDPPLARGIAPTVTRGHHAEVAGHTSY